jgi:hypothetical protein
VANPADLLANVARVAVHGVCCWEDLSIQQQPISIFKSIKECLINPDRIMLLYIFAEFLEK